MSLQERLQCSNLLEVHNKLMRCHEDKKNEISKLDEMLIEKHHKFLWEDTDKELTWEEELARKYYDKLFKEYCICDLTKYKENKVALRWRTRNEVISGRGQFSCAEKYCNGKEQLKTWEVNFCYLEGREKKNALVKIKLCSNCSVKLNYHSKKREIKRLRKISKSKHKGDNKIVTKNESASSSTSEVEEVSSGGSVDSRNNIQNPWSQKVEVDIKSREEEMDEYLDELLF